MKPKQRSQKVPESGVLRACLDLLAAEKIWHERRNTVPVLVSDGRGGKRPIRVAEPGTADIFCTPMSRIKCNDDYWNHLYVLWIECKSDTGKQSPDQIEFQRRAEESGHDYLLVRDVDTLKDWLKKHEIRRTPCPSPKS